MNKTSYSSYSTWVAGIVLVILAIFIYMSAKQEPIVAPVAQHVVGSGLYSCIDGKGIKAQYSEGDTQAVVTPGQPPVPVGSVSLILSDGRTLTLPQTISGSGVRYADASEATIFWNKGNGVTFIENGQETYKGCMSVSQDNLSALPAVYGNGSKGFTLRHPNLYTVNEAHTYTGFGPNKTINGIKFTIPPSVATGTNLSLDSYISVEQISSTSTCSAGLFLDNTLGGQSVTVTESGTEYSFSSSTEAAAGNRYEEIVYALPGTNPCVAVRYFIHYGAIGNYPAGQVKEFDKAALLNQFDAIRRSLVILQ